MPWLLMAAMLLFLLDWLIMAGLQLGGRYFGRRGRQAFAAGVLLAVISMGITQTAKADTAAKAVTYAGGLHLAYARSGDPAVDQMTHKGLEGLSSALEQRTSVEPTGIVAIDPETDDLAFFPLIYWPVSAQSPKLSPQALKNVQYYLDHGGTILFDTRDQISAPRTGIHAGSGRNAGILRDMVGSLNIPPLEALPEDHVLTKSFYLLKTMPGRYEDGIIWVEERTASGRDGVSSVIVGSHDWAHAWAQDARTRRGEMALRFGVNLVMYALTGNYKDDQVHVPHILERLGQ